MKKLFFLIVLSILLLGQSDYYQNIDPSKSTFIQDLQTLIRNNYTKIPYDQYQTTILADYESSDAGDGKRKVTCVYSGEVYLYTPPFSWGYFSREHTWCHSWMPTYSSKTGNEYSDQHHLFPTNQNKANGVRNNHPLGKVITITSSYLGCKYGKNENDKPVFEPREEHKGDAARALLYMSLMYNGVNNKNWTFNYLNSTTLPNLGEDTQSVAILLQWHKQDPPDSWEIGRNDYIQSIQGNRNPFVDHPEWVDYIDWYSLSYKTNNVKLAQEPSNHIKNLQVVSFNDSTISIQWEQPDPGLQNATGVYLYISTDLDLKYPIDRNKYEIDTNYNDGIGRIYLPISQTSFVFKNLEPATNYLIAAFTYNGDADSINYKTNEIIPKIIQKTSGIAKEPQYSVNDFTVQRTGPNYVTVTWSYDSLPKPAGYFISYSNSKNKILIPQDEQNYQDDFDLTDSIGCITITDNKITSFYIDGLELNKRYYFYIFPFNGTNAKNYKVDDYKSCQAFTKYVNATELLITEYIEAGENNQFIEIYNGTGVKANLNDYTLRIYSDGATTPTYELPLSGYLEDNETIVIKNSAATLNYNGIAISWDNLKFDGNDAVSLYRISTKSDIDVVGVIGQNPGTEWKYLTSWTTKERTLRRKNSITNPVVNKNNFETLGIEWDYADKNDLSDLGKHYLNALSNISLLHKYDNSSDSLSVVSKGGVWEIYPNSKIITAYTGGVTTPEHSYISYDLTKKIPDWQLGSEFENEWVGWMDLNRTTVSGWGTNSYSCGMVLAANNPVLNDPNTKGYAVGFKYHSTGNDSLVIFKFENGIGSGSVLPNGATQILASDYYYVDADDGVNFYVKLNSNGTWTIKTKKGAKLAFADAINPLNYNETSNTSTITDDSFEGTEFKYCGWVYAHSTSATTSTDFANLGAGMYKSYIPLSLNSLYFDINEYNENTVLISVNFTNLYGIKNIVLEKSFNSINWHKVSEFELTNNNYSIYDKILSNITYYRIKVISSDGKINYSGVYTYNRNKISNFQLNQNYPNPFNPTTIISYYLPISTNVKLKIYNSLGEEIKVLVDNFQNKGYYEIEFNANNLSSGIYFYALETPNKIISKKMLLLK